VSEATIRIRPVTKGRPRLGRRRRAYTPDKTVQFEAEVARQWAEQNPDLEPLTGPLGMQVVFGSDHIEITVWELEESQRPKYVTGDVDNYQKSVADALNGVAYVDDKQVHYMELFFTKEVPDETH
jgi:crossover junction endodeoxyribonuclease RusA